MKVVFLYAEDPFYSLSVIERFEALFPGSIQAVVFPAGFISFKRILRSVFIYGPWKLFLTALHVLYWDLRGGRVKRYLRQKKILVLEPRSVNDPELVETLRKLQPDLVISNNCPQRVGHALLSLPTRGAFNLHLGALPKYRGVFPLLQARLNHEPTFGVTTHRMDAKFDNGPILFQEQLPIQESDDLFDLYPRAFEVGGELIIRSTEAIMAGEEAHTPNDASRATYHSFPSPTEIWKYHKAVWGGRCARTLRSATSGLLPGLLAFVVILVQLRVGMLDMSPERFREVVPYVAYLLVGPFLAGRVVRVFWADRQVNWSLEFVYSWTCGLVVELTLWAIAFQTGWSPAVLFWVFLGCSLFALGSRSVFVFELPSVKGSDVFGIAASFLGLYFWVHYRFMNVPAVDEQVRLWGGFSEYQDLIFHWSYAAQFKNMRFGELPMVSGLPLRYVFGANLHMGLASLVSGANLELILFRGLPVATSFVLSLGLSGIACQIAKRQWAGGVAVAAFFFANSLSGIWQADSQDFFGNLLRFSLSLSPNFLFSLPIFVVAFHLIVRICVETAAAEERRRWWLALVVLTVFGGLTKGGFLPVLIIGLVPVAAMSLRNSRVMAKRVCVCVSVCAVVFFVTQPYVLASYESASMLTIAPMQFFRSIQGYKGLLEKWPEARSFVGAWFWLWVPFAAFAFMPIVASSLVQCVVQRKRFLQEGVHVLFAGVVVAPLVFTTLVERRAETFYLQGYSVMLGAVWFAVVSCRAGQTRSIDKWHILWTAVHATCFVAACTAGVSAIGNAPVRVEYFRDRYDRRPLVSGGEIEAIRFIARHSQPSDVVASNFHECPFREETKVRFWYHSALSERSHFLEGWGVFTSDPYAAYADDIQTRFRLLKGVFSGNIEIALELKKKYGVRYLLEHHSWAESSGRVSRHLPDRWEVFANEAASVYRIP